MPTLKQLVEELSRIGVDPDAIRVPAQIYDDLVDDAENIEDNPTDE